MVQTLLPAIGKTGARPQNLEMPLRRLPLAALLLLASCQHRNAIAPAELAAANAPAGAASAPSTKVGFQEGMTEQWAKACTDGCPFPQGALVRGRLDGADILVIADQHSRDDAQVGRALTGIEGEKLQGFLNGLGAGTNYVIIRTLPVETLGKDPREIQTLLDQSRSWRNGLVAKILAANPEMKMVLTLGPQADQEAKTMKFGNLPAISLTGPGGYQRAFESIRHSTAWEKDRRMMLSLKPLAVPATDLPYGVSSPAVAEESARKPASKRASAKRAPASTEAPVVVPAGTPSP